MIKFIIIKQKMIFTTNILSGYQSIVGSFLFHLPMLVTMCLFIRIPYDDIDTAFPDETHLVIFWYWFTMFLHIWLGVMSAQELYIFEYEGPPWFKNLLCIMSTVGRLSSMGNLCLMLHIFGNS